MRNERPSRTIDQSPWPCGGAPIRSDTADPARHEALGPLQSRDAECRVLRVGGSRTRSQMTGGRGQERTPAIARVAASSAASRSTVDGRFPGGGVERRSSARTRSRSMTAGNGHRHRRRRVSSGAERLVVSTPPHEAPRSCRSRAALGVPTPTLSRGIGAASASRTSRSAEPRAPDEVEAGGVGSATRRRLGMTMTEGARPERPGVKRWTVRA